MVASDLSPEERRSSRFLLTVLAVLGVASLLIVWPFLTGTIFALVLGFLLQRPYRAVLRVVRVKALAAALMVLLVVLAVVVPLLIIGWELTQQAQNLLDDAGEGGYEETIVDGMVSLGVPEATARDLLVTGVAEVGTLLKAGALPTLTALVSVAANVGILLFLLYFVLVGHDRLTSLVQRALPLAPERREHLLHTIGQRVRALFMGTFLVALLQGIAAGIGWWLFGFPSPVFWGFVMTILAVIPAVGPILVMAPAGIIALAQGNAFAGIGVIVWGLAVVGLIDNFTRPYIVGRSSDVHPGVVLLGTLGGLSVFGATGFIIGPLILSMLAPILQEWEAIRPGPG